MIKMSIRRVHKWFAVGASLVLLAWVVSGIVMVMPYQWLTRLVGATPAASSAAGGSDVAADYRDFQVSIPGAIAALDERLGARAEVRSIRIMMFQGRPVYEIIVASGSAHLIDGMTGAPIEVDRQLAEQLARGAVPEPGRIATVAQIDQRDFHYWGTVPAYKVVFDDPSGYVVYVSESGVVTRTSRWGRIHRWITSVHELEPVRLLFSSNRLRVVALMFFSVLSLFVVVSGVYLALPARWRFRRVAARRI